MSAAIPVQKRKGFSFSWLLPLNLFLATIFIATCGYVVNLMFLALEPPTDVIVPNLVGKSLTDAKSLGAERKFIVEVVNEQFSDKYPEDSIYQMRPEAGRHIRENKKVTVWVSKGPRMVTVPDVFDVSFDKARQVLEKEGLRIGDKKYEWDVMTAKGNIVQQIPPQGENRARGTRVDLIISKGPEPIAPQGPVPGEGPYVDPPVDEGGAVENEKESSLTLQYDVPADTNSHIIRIDVTDSRGTRTLITESHNAGDKVPLDVTGYGSKITFRVYDNDILQQKITGPPWSGGEKAP
ncbi:MAG: PASTA domain-containing protein [Fibrella sp.]|nr:PASTA domain-containing protein [Armatimonadota bacterium]